MTTDATRAHIDAERLAAWADHGLPPADAAEVELHLSECERCQEVLAAFVRSEPAPAVVIPFWARRPVQWSAAGLAAAAALLLIVQTQSPTVPVPDSVVATALEESAAQRKPAPLVAEAQEARKTSPAAPDDVRKESQGRAFAERDERPNLADRAASRKIVRSDQRAREGALASQATPPPPPPRPATPPPAQASAPPPVQVTAAAPVVAPPPPPAAPPRANVVGGIAGRASGLPAMNESITMDAAALRVFEIIAPGPAALRRMALAAGAGRGGVAPSEFRQESAPARWRVVAGMRVELSLDAGATWTVLPMEPALTTPLVAGVAAGQSVCWLVGADGVVLVTAGGRTFRRVSLPERVQLVSVTAEDNLRATVTAADGRRFSTVDGGLTWK